MLDPREPLAQRVRVDVERRAVGDRAAPGEVLLQRVEQRGAALAVVREQRLDRGPVTVAGRVVEPQVDEVLVRAELLVAERAAGGAQRARDLGGAGGLPQRLAALGDAAPGALTPSTTSSAVATASQCSTTRSAAAASGISTTARSPSRPASKKPTWSRPRSRAASRVDNRLPVGADAVRRRGGLAVQEHVRAGEVEPAGAAASTARSAEPSASASNRSFTRSRRQPRDQVGALEPHRGLVGERAQQLLVAGAEAAGAQHAEQPELLVGRHQRRRQQRRALVVGPDVAARCRRAGRATAAPAAARRPAGAGRRAPAGRRPQPQLARPAPAGTAGTGRPRAARAPRTSPPRAGARAGSRPRAAARPPTTR